MWIELISHDQKLRDTLVKHCAVAEDYWRCNDAYRLGERLHLASYRGLVIFDIRTATEDDRRHFLAEAPAYAGLCYLIVDEKADVDGYLDSLTSRTRVDIVPYDASIELWCVRLNYARDTQLVEESRRATWISVAREASRLARLQGLVDQAPFILLSLDTSGHVVHGNAMAREFFGRDYHTGYDALLNEFVHPDERASLLGAAARAMSLGETFRSDARIRSGDGIWRWMSVTGGPTFDVLGHRTGVALSLTDTTEERAVHEALREREHKMRTLADSLPVKIWRADATGQPDYFNKAWQAFTGIDPQSFNSEEWLNLIHPDERVRASTLWRQAVEAGTPFVMDYRMMEPRTGTYRWQRVKAVPIKNKNGTVRRWFGATLDIDETRREAETIDRLYRELLEINRGKDALLLALSTELRSPLLDLIKCHRLFSSGDLDEEDRAAVDAIFRSAETLLRHVDNLLDMSHMMTGSMRIYPVATDLMQVIATAIRSLESEFRKARITLELCLPQSMNPVVVDPYRFGQVVWNLLSNALKFTPAGGRVWLALRRDEHAVVLEVEDTGKGIAEDFLPKVFQRFTQEEKYSTRQQGGLGLGLAIAEHIVSLHGGRITASSLGRNRGARFEVQLPVQDHGH